VSILRSWIPKEILRDGGHTSWRLFKMLIEALDFLCVLAVITIITTVLDLTFEGACYVLRKRER